jgi:molybdate transport system substrate-binding protein
MKVFERAQIMRELFIGCVVLLSLGCHPQTARNTQADSSELTVAAAANLIDAFTEIGARFTSETGTRVVFSFGATADLSKQI